MMTKKMVLTICLPNDIHDNRKKIFIILFQHPGDLILEYMLATEDDDTLLINIIKEEEILATAKYVIMKYFSKLMGKNIRNCLLG